MEHFPSDVKFRIYRQTLMFEHLLCDTLGLIKDLQLLVRLISSLPCLASLTQNSLPEECEGEEDKVDGEGGGGGEAEPGQELPLRCPELGVSVGLVRVDGDHQEEDGAEQGEKPLLQQIYILFPLNNNS